MRVAKAMVMTALMAAAGVAHAGDSAKMVLDLRTGPRASGGDETLLFSSLWDGGADATVTIAQDGVAIAKNLAGEGEQAWSVPYNGTYELTHVTYTNGVAGKVETATFAVTGKADPPEITNVVATPSKPWDGRVSISFNVVNSPAAACPDWNKPYLSIVATDNVTGSNYVSEVSALSAETDELLADALAGSNGTHEVTWDFTAQGIDFVSSNVTFTVAYIRPFDVRGDWCVIDLSGGPDAESYPVSYLDAEPAGGFNTDAYKTTNLVMRLVEPGTFTMGADRNAVFGNHGDQLHSVTFTQPFYCAVFETTQRQWELVKGDRPSWFNNDDCYATRPVEQVSYDDIRGGNLGSQWPTTNSVDAISFLGYLRSRTSLASLDLPTEAQWEYACRAGTVTDLNNGKNVTGEIDMNLDEVARNWWNGGSPNPNLFPPEFPAQNCEANNGTATVGSYLPNAWGLYDMHGNVWEWCLDWWANDLDDTSVTNPPGSSSDSCRLIRGGCWTGGTPNCTSYSRLGIGPSDVVRDIGFRLVRTLSSNLEGERSAEAVAGAERAGTVCAGTASEAIRVGKDFTADDIALADYAGVYDGEGHGIGIETNAIAGLVLRYASGALGESALPFGDEVPLFTNVCEATVWVEASAPGYIAFTTNATVKITPASLTITAKDQTYRYNGTTQGEGDTLYGDPAEIAGKVKVEGLKGADTLASIMLDGQGTDAGTYPIEPQSAGITNVTGDVTGNYSITYENGTLTILAPAEVTDVRATVNGAWEGKVQISFNVTNSPAFGLPDWNKPFLSIVATDNVTGSNYVSVASALSDNTDAADGPHTVTWDFKAQGIEFASTNVTFTVAYLRMPDWCVIDLSGGKNAVSYPVTYLAAEPDGGFTNDLYRTTKLAMRLIGPGTFEMGDSVSTETTEITNAFYCAVFETTQRQWELVTGKRPSWFTNETCYATRPVENVSWNMIRGDANTYNWPNVQGVDPESFVGVLRQKTDLNALDLPTEAQWEYACRAGTTSKYNNGGDTEGDLKALGRYWDNGGSDYSDSCATDHGTAAVGSYLPNAWGLYDMHGNVWEWCLNPSGSFRVLRGGSWRYNASYCTSSGRGDGDPSNGIYDVGFRLARTLSDDFESERSAEAAAGAERAGTVCAGAASKPIAVGMKDFAAGGIALADYAGVYDGEGHGIGIETNAIAGLVLRYAVGEGGSPGGLALPFGDTPPTFVDVTNVTVWVEASAPGYIAFTTNATLTITPRTVTFAGQSETNAYTGSEIEITGVVAEGLVSGHTHNVVFSAKGTDAGGPYEGVITDAGDVVILSGEEDVTANYDVSVANGALVITPLEVTPDGVEITLALPEGGYVGDGTAKEPAASVLCGGRPLAVGVDYDIAYSDNVEPGTATVTVTFKGNYAGTATAHFDIAAPAPEPQPQPQPEPQPQPQPEPQEGRRVLWYTDAPFQLDRTTTYNGYLVDTNANDAVVGMIAVKAGKPNKTTGASRLTVTIRLTGQKAITVKGSTVDGTFRAMAGKASPRLLDIALGLNSLSGAFGPYLVDGSRDMFAARDADSKARSAQALDRWKGNYAVAWKASSAANAPYHTLTVAVKAKGRVTVKGTLADGTRVLSSTRLLVSGLRTRVNTGSRLLVGERECAVAVSWAKKNVSVACLLWFGEDGTVSCENLPDGATALVAPVGGGFAAGTKFRVDQAAVAAAFPGILEDLSFPDGAPAELKLKYKAEDGTFSGSFKVYVDNGRRVKAVTVKVCGVVLDGKGYGSAYVKKVGDWEATVE